MQCLIGQGAEVWARLPLVLAGKVFTQDLIAGVDLLFEVLDEECLCSLHGLHHMLIFVEASLLSPAFMLLLEFAYIALDLLLVHLLELPQESRLRLLSMRTARRIPVFTISPLILAFSLLSLECLLPFLVRCLLLPGFLLRLFGVRHLLRIRAVPLTDFLQLGAQLGSQLVLGQAAEGLGSQATSMLPRLHVELAEHALLYFGEVLLSEDRIEVLDGEAEVTSLLSCVLQSVKDVAALARTGTHTRPPLLRLVRAFRSPVGPLRGL